MNKKQPLIESIAEYATQLQYDDISEQAIQSAKHLIFDSVGTALGGYQDPLGIKAARYAAERWCGDQATLLGDGRTSTLQGAAFANATMVKILGMDDSHRSSSHVAAQVIPAALAVAEHKRLGGRDLIVAIVAAYDLAVRVGCAVREAQRQRGLDVKGTVGSMAAALAAGLCGGLDADKLSHALALAADMSSGTEQYVYDRGKCDTKDLISGFAARNGVFAAELAAYDFYGPRGALDGEYGFFRAFGAGAELADFSDLGHHFGITTTAFKPHGGCRHTHQAVDAVQKILAQDEIDPAAIQRVVVKTYKYATQPLFRVNPEPGTRELAGLSLRVATAVTLVRHSAWPQDYAYWDDPQVRRLRGLVEIKVDPEIERLYPDRNGCRVIVTLEDGRVYEGYTPFAKGEPEFPMTEAELKTKFETLSRPILPPNRAEEIFDFCMALETAQDVGALLSLTATRVNDNAEGAPQRG